jgi:hypothetical protein
VIGAHAPRRPELRPRRRYNEQGCQRAAFGNTAQHVESGRIGPVQILECQHDGLNLCARQHPIGERRQLPATQLLGRQSRARSGGSGLSRSGASSGTFSAAIRPSPSFLAT